MVVPHNAELLALAQCHINVEFSFTVNVIPYLYKYIFKGPDHVQVAVHSSNSADEIQNYTYSRYISSSEAAWRILGFAIHPRRHPSVGTLPVHAEGMSYVAFVSAEEDEPSIDEDSSAVVRELRSHAQKAAPEKLLGKLSKLEQYLLRPAIALNKRGVETNLTNIKYVDLYDRFDFTTTSKPSARDRPARAKTNMYIKARQQVKVHRMWVKRPKSGEDFYIRLILANFPSPIVGESVVRDALDNDTILKSAWAGLRGGCDTFQQRALELGLLSEKNEYEQCFEEAVQDEWMTGRAARQLFVTCIAEGASSQRLKEKYIDPDEVPLGGEAGMGMPLWSDFHTQLCPPGEQSSSTLVNRCRQKALRDIADRIKCFDKTMSDFGLPEPAETETELAHEVEQFRPATGATPNVLRDELQQKFNQEIVPALNAADATEQRALFHRIVNAVMSNEGAQIYVGGKSGRGKTWLINAVTTYLRLRGKVVVCCASTGIAAVNHHGGRTAHNLFSIPVVTTELDEQTGLECAVDGRSDRAHLLAAADLIIWDEFAMSNQRDVDSVSRLLQRLKNNNSKLFGGASFVGIGDVHQIPPVIQYASKEQIVQSSVVSWRGWRDLERYELTHPHRDGADRPHSAFVDRCGAGLLDQANTANGRAGLVRLENLATVDDIDALINHVYPDDASLADPGHAILSCRNQAVDEINEKIADQRLKTEWHELYSSDVVQDQNVHDPLNMYGEDFLNLVSPNLCSTKQKNRLTRDCMCGSLRTRGGTRRTSSD